jgi:hypothetical protein
MYKKFTAHLAECQVTDVGSIRTISKNYALSLRPHYDLYARKYHAFLFTEWCRQHNVMLPADWNPEGYWAGNFA